MSDIKTTLAIVCDGGFFACGFRDQAGKITTSQNDDHLTNPFGQISELTPPEVYSGLLENSDLSTINEVICISGPGSYTGLRIALAFAKGIAVSRRVPLKTCSKIDLSYLSLKTTLNFSEEQSSPEISIGTPLSRKTHLIATGRKLADFSSNCWVLKDSESAIRFLAEQELGYELLNGRIQNKTTATTQESPIIRISYLDEIFNHHSSLSGHTEASHFSIEQIGLLEPEYGAVFSALTAEEQKQSRKNAQK